MFTNYQKRFSITSYEDITFNSVTGFEQVVTYGIPTYYVVDFWNQRVIQFDKNWNYRKYDGLPYNLNRNLKYLNEYFFFSADQNFYKTDANFYLIASYYNSDTNYRSIYFDSSSSLFYVSGDYVNGVSIFDKNCNFQRFLVLGSYSPGNALSYFNGNLYGEDGSSVVVASKATGAFVAKYDTVCYYGIYSITINLFGYMAVSCDEGPIALYNARNGTYLNLQLEPSNEPYFTAVDANSRFVSMSSTAIDIYF